MKIKRVFNENLKNCQNTVNSKEHIYAKSRSEIFKNKSI